MKEGENMGWGHRISIHYRPDKTLTLQELLEMYQDKKLLTYSQAVDLTRSFNTIMDIDKCLIVSDYFNNIELKSSLKINGHTTILSLEDLLAFREFIYQYELEDYKIDMIKNQFEMIEFAGITMYCDEIFFLLERT